MVPKQKNNQRIPSGYFSFAEYQKCCEVIKELESSGSTVLLTAMKPALAAYYVSLISNKVVNRGPRDAVIVRKMPRDKDQIIEALNQKLNDKPSSSLSESESFRANEVWLYESLNGLSVPNIVFAARTVRQLALAGVSLLVSINGQQSGGMKEIIHSCKARRWDFDSPTLEEYEGLMERITDKRDLHTVEELGRELGFFRAPKDSKPRLLSFSATDPADIVEDPADSFMSDSDVLDLIKKHKKDRKPRESLGSKVWKQLVSAGSNGRLNAIKLSAGLSVIAVISALQFELASSSGGIIEESQIVPPSGLRDQDKHHIKSTREKSDIELIPTPSTSVAKVIKDDETELMKIFSVEQGLNAIVVGAAPTLTDDFSTDIQKKNLPVKAPPRADIPLKKEEYFVQHAAFSQLEGAMVWKNNKASEISTEIFIKGDNPKRFVVLSGPFREKNNASDSIADSSDAFVVPSEAIGEHVYSVSGL
jgi:hypothetical protein